MSERLLNVEERAERGSNAAQRMRKGGKVPSVIYGGDRPTVAITVERRKILDLLRAEGAGSNAVFLLQLGEGKQRHAMIRDMQVDPITGRIDHIDFQRIDMTQKIRVQVPVELLGEPEGVRNEGGIVDFVTREVEVECLPSDIPETLGIDISALHVGQHVEAGGLEMPEGVTLEEDPERVIAGVSHAKVEEVEEEEDELLEAEGEEPEVVGRSKDDDDGEGGDDAQDQE